jgi:hypothetical protein
MRIKVKENKVRLRRSPSIAPTNVVRLLVQGTVFDNAEKQGDWWKTNEGYIHNSMVEVVADTPPKQPETPPEVPKPTNGAVPYRSQWDTDASSRSSDCGQTCVAMLAEWKGIHVKVNDLRFQSSAKGLTTPQDLLKNMSSVGLKGRIIDVPMGAKPSTPAICLIWYGGLKRSNVQDKSFRGWHWLILLEQNASYVVTHDPDYFNPRRDEGAFKRYGIDEWNAAFLPYYSRDRRTAVILDE